MLVVGLTGGIATGKSTVSTLLRTEHHLPVIDADILARRAVEPNTAAFRAILATFGDDLAVHDSSGRIIGFDRTELGKRVFSGDEVARQKLNRIVHPAVRWLMVREVLWEWLVVGSRVVVLDIPLLFESGLDRFVGVSLVVATKPETQLERLVGREGPRLSCEDAKGRIASQWDIEDKARLADVVIENDGSREELELCVREVVRKQLTRGWLWNFIMRMPPFGLTVALCVFLRRLLRRKSKDKKTS
jgi:dephospho-CoA kinase